MNRILLHACCAPCASASARRLIDEGLTVTLFYSNSNIAPVEEYSKRLESLVRLADILALELIVDHYQHEDWLQTVRGFEDEPEKGRRCQKCFRFSLTRACDKAAELGIGAFATSLTISPHKSSRVIFDLASDLQGFKPYDFKKADGFSRSLQLAREYGLYRQGYCGCEYSLKRENKPVSGECDLVAGEL